MGIKFKVELCCNMCEAKVDTTAHVSANLTTSESYYETRTIPDGIDLNIDPDLPDGWSIENHGGYGFGRSDSHRCPECTKTERARLGRRR